MHQPRLLPASQVTSPPSIIRRRWVSRLAHGAEESSCVGAAAADDLLTDDVMRWVGVASPQIRAEDSLRLITSGRLSLHIQSSLLFPSYCACILVANEPECKLWVEWGRLNTRVSFNWRRCLFFLVFFLLLLVNSNDFYEFITRKNMNWENYVGFFFPQSVSLFKLAVMPFLSERVQSWITFDYDYSGFLIQQPSPRSQGVLITSGLEWLLERCQCKVHWRLSYRHNVLKHSMFG